MTILAWLREHFAPVVRFSEPEPTMPRRDKSKARAQRKARKKQRRKK